MADPRWLRDYPDAPAALERIVQASHPPADRQRWRQWLLDLLTTIRTAIRRRRRRPVRTVNKERRRVQRRPLRLSGFARALLAMLVYEVTRRSHRAHDPEVASLLTAVCETTIQPDTVKTWRARNKPLLQVAQIFFADGQRRAAARQTARVLQGLRDAGSEF